MNIRGCSVTVIVDSDGGLDNQSEVAAAIVNVGQNMAALVVDEIRRNFQEDTPWPAGRPSASADSAAAPAAATPAAPKQRSVPTLAWLAAVAASGGPPPGPPPNAEPGREIPPPPPPSRAPPPLPMPTVALPKAAATPPPDPPVREPKARAARPSSVPPAAPSYDPEDWGARLAAARAHGEAVALALATNGKAPPQTPHPSPLRNRVWAVVGGFGARAEAHVGLYARWEGGAERAVYGPHACVARGYPSMAEARVFCDGAGLAEPIDRR
jgi:hypothetical protein